MTPYEIGIMLHYYARGGDYDKPAPILEETLEGLVRVGVLQHGGIGDVNGYRIRQRYEITQAGEVYVKALCSIPVPTPTWEIRLPDIPKWWERGA